MIALVNLNLMTILNEENKWEKIVYGGNTESYLNKYGFNIYNNEKIKIYNFTVKEIKEYNLSEGECFVFMKRNRMLNGYTCSFINDVIETIKSSDKLIGYKCTQADGHPHHNIDKFQFEVGKTYHQEGTMELCRRGLHFSLNMINAIAYYNDIPNIKLFKVSVPEDAYIDIGDDKMCVSDIVIEEELDLKKELLSYCGNDYGKFVNLLYDKCIYSIELDKDILYYLFERNDDVDLLQAFKDMSMRKSISYISQYTHSNKEYVLPIEIQRKILEYGGNSSKEYINFTIFKEDKEFLDYRLKYNPNIVRFYISYKDDERVGDLLTIKELKQLMDKYPLSCKSTCLKIILKKFEKDPALIKDNLEIFEFYIPLFKDYCDVDFENIIVKNIDEFRKLPITTMEKLYRYGLCGDNIISLWKNEMVNKNYKE